MAKEKPKAKPYPGKSKPAAAPPGGKAPSPPGIRVNLTPGVPICIDPVAGYTFPWTSATATTLSIFEWTGTQWRFVRLIKLGHAIAPPHPDPLDKDLFPGRYVGQRVLAVYTPPTRTGG